MSFQGKTQGRAAATLMKGTIHHRYEQLFIGRAGGEGDTKSGLPQRSEGSQQAEREENSCSGRSQHAVARQYLIVHLMHRALV